MLTGTNILALKVVVAISFLIVGLEYLHNLGTYQVASSRNTEKSPVPERSLFSFGWDFQPNERSIGNVRVPPLLNVISRPSATSYITITTDLPPRSVIEPVISFKPSQEIYLTSTNNTVVVCPLIPPNLHGPITVVSDPKQVPSWEAQEKLFPDLSIGGRYSPKFCQSRHKVALIVPYRDREDHLRTFLYNIHTVLMRQQIEYGVYVVEQYGRQPFNRAMLLNIGVSEAVKQHDYACFVFHDVDLLPEDDRNIYSCPIQPRHMSVAINSFQYKLPYGNIFGGVSAMTVEHFRQVNGFSNIYWGWGGEDDDMSNRLRQKRLNISRYPTNIARYTMLKHPKDKENPDRFKLIYSGAKRMTNDGYNSLKYKLVNLELHKLYTRILVDLLHLK